MAKVGDTVRYLNAVGGGVITKIDGRMAYVEEDGFETPVLVSELVVTIPAGTQQNASGPNLMFNQDAFDRGRQTETKSDEPKRPLPPVEETSHGDRLSITLAFEPRDIKKLSQTLFNIVLVNDSNFFLLFSFMHRTSDSTDWKLSFSGEVAPNELVDIDALSHSNLLDFEHIALQAIAFKKDKDFSLHKPVTFEKKLDLAKFHKLHCFNPGLYFDSPVLEIPVITNGIPAVPTIDDKELRSMLSEKFKVDKPSKKKQNHSNNDAANPNKLLPLVEVDLHIGELTDSLAGLEPKDMLEMQLETVRRTMQQHRRRIGQKIVFIHGKGNGVLRKELIKLLNKEYPSADIQDASFREYGFGASLITIKS